MITIDKNHSSLTAATFALAADSFATFVVFNIDSTDEETMEYLKNKNRLKSLT